MTHENTNMSHENFYILFQRISENPTLKYGHSKDICISMGIDIVKHTSDINHQDDILNKLLFLFPEHAPLYYQMGMIFKQINPQRAMMWFNLANQKAPSDYQILVELSLLLVKSGLFAAFFDLNKGGIFENIIYKRKDNYEFLEIYVNAAQPNLIYRHVIPCLQKMIQHRCQRPAANSDEKREKWWAYHHLGFAYIANGFIDKAIEHTTKAVDLANKFDLGIHAKLLSFQNMLAFYDFEYHDQKENFNRYLQINTYLPNVTSMFTSNIFLKDRIRIGYVSSDFVGHPVSNFILPILKNHKREQFDIYVFTNTTKVDDSLSDYKSYAIESMDGKTAAKFIYDKKIDVLIDLNGHTVKNRLDVFALNPAPIQMTYLGYPNTTGLKSIKYRITDAVADDPATSQPYSEELIRLPTCFLLFQSIRYKTPCEQMREIDPNRIVLGALNKEKKNSPSVLSTWGNILRECPSTILVIKLETMDIADERKEFYTKALGGVDASRIIMWNKLSNEDYNTMFSKIDVLLDTYPYSGTTTTCETLFHSVPVVTMKHKDYHCHNVSTSIMTQCGLSELVASSPQEYVDLVKDLVADPQRIEEYKRTIHDKFVTGMNVENFMRGYEDAIMRCLV